MQHNFIKTILWLLILGVAILGLTSSVRADSSSDTVTICHATASTTNPYVLKTPSKSGDVSGHDKHDGPLFFSGVTNWGDIIPPFDYQDCSGKVCVTKSYPGKNWDNEGQAVWNNSCTLPALDCDGDYDGASPNGDDTCVTPTVTPVPSCDPNDHDDADDCAIFTPTPTVTPVLDCDGDTDGSDSEGECVTPTVTVTPSVTPAVTQTPTQSPSTSGGSGDGHSDGRSDGLSSCPQCTQAPGTSSPVQAVLGASTMASTGTFENELMSVLFASGVALLGYGLLRHRKERKS